MVDTPGLNVDSDMELHGAFNAIMPGPHVLIIVFSVRTPHDVMRKTCQRYRARLGDAAMKHTAIVFTGVDMLESNGSNFRDYLVSLPSDIKQLIGTQLVAFNNIANAPLVNVLQVKELMAKFELICTTNFGLYFQATRTSGAGVADVFKQNSEVLERNISNVKATIHNGSNAAEQHIESNVIIQNGESDNGERLDLALDPRAVEPHEDLQLNPIRDSETISRVSDDASMVSSNQEKDGQSCGCFSSITRKFKSSQKEPEFTQFK